MTEDENAFKLLKEMGTKPYAETVLDLLKEYYKSPNVISNYTIEEKQDV